MKSNLPINFFIDVLHKVWEPELKKIDTKLTIQLGIKKSHEIVKAAWDLALNEAQGVQVILDSSVLWLFPSLKERAQFIGQLIFAAWQENDEKMKIAEVALLSLGQSKLVIQLRRVLKRARAIILLKKLGSAIRREDKNTAAWLAQSLQHLGYAFEVAAVWQSATHTQQASA